VHFPDKFDFIPLDGSQACPDPFPGNVIGILLIGGGGNIEVPQRLLVERPLMPWFSSHLSAEKIQYGLLVKPVDNLI